MPMRAAALKSREECLQHAEECVRAAASAHLESTKTAMLDSAALWRKLAAYAVSGANASVPHQRADSTNQGKASADRDHGSKQAADDD